MRNIPRNSFFFLAFWLLFLIVKLLTFSILLLRPVYIGSRSLRAVIAGFFTHKLETDSSPSAVLYFAAFFPENAGYEYRLRQWAERLEQRNCRIAIRTTFEREQFTRLRDANALLLYLIPMYRRCWQILGSVFYDRVIVRRELVLFNDYGRLFLDKLLLAIHPNAVLDFDDDLSAAKGEPKQPVRFEQLLLGTGNKFNESLALYKHFFPGSEYLAERVRALQPNLPATNIQVIPTCVDYARYPIKDYTQAAVKGSASATENDSANTTENDSADTVADKLVFGWIGGNGNQQYLDALMEPLHRFAQTRQEQVELHIISGSAYRLPEMESSKAAFKLVNKSWSLETQIEDLLQIDIGLMPLTDTAEERGKCGFKLIQYMGLGIVSIASGITVNQEIISDEDQGFLVQPSGDWFAVFCQVADQKAAFSRIGKKAHAKIAAHYSFSANEENYFEFLTTKIESGRYVRHSRDVQL